MWGRLPKAVFASLLLCLVDEKDKQGLGAGTLLAGRRWRGGDHGLGQGWVALLRF